MGDVEPSQEVMDEFLVYKQRLNRRQRVRLFVGMIISILAMKIIPGDAEEVTKAFGVKTAEDDEE